MSLQIRKISRDFSLFSAFVDYLTVKWCNQDFSLQNIAQNGYHRYRRPSTTIPPHLIRIHYDYIYCGMPVTYDSIFFLIVMSETKSSAYFNFHLK